MKRFLTLTQNMRVLLTLGVVVILLFVKDVMDKRNVTSLGDTFSSVYEDRLLPESYIYQLAEHLYQKKMLLDNLGEGSNLLAETHKGVDTHNSAMQAIMKTFEQTNLTIAEAACFGSFKLIVRETTAVEQQLLSAVAKGDAIQLLTNQLNHQFNISSANLQQLSAIQLAEAKRLSEESKKIIAGSAMLSKFEVALLLIVALLLQALVMSKNVNHVPVSKPELN